MHIVFYGIRVYVPGLGYALRSRSRFALTATVGAVLLLAIAAGGIGVFLGMREFVCNGQCGGIAQITLDKASFNSTSGTLYFSLNNSYPSNTTIPTIIVNQVPCKGTFPTILAHTITSSSCTVTTSGDNFVRHQNVTFVITLENAQVITGTVTAD